MEVDMNMTISSDLEESDRTTSQSSTEEEIREAPTTRAKSRREKTRRERSTRSNDSTDRTRSRSRSRSRASSDSEDHEVGYKGSGKKIGESQKKKRRPNLVDTLGVYDPQQLGEMEIEELGELALRWVQEIDEARLKSTKLIQGRINGQIKKRLINLKGAINALMSKNKAVGGPGYTRMRIKELERELDESREEVRVLRRGTIDRKQAQQAVGWRGERIEAAGETLNGEEFPAPHPSRRSVEFLEVEPDVGYLLDRSQDSDALWTQTKYEKEFRNLPPVNRPPIRGVSSVIPEADKTGKPRIISNIQVALPRQPVSQTTETPTSEWKEVAGKKRKNRGKIKSKKRERGGSGLIDQTEISSGGPAPGKQLPPPSSSKPLSPREEAIRMAKKRVPKASAVAIQGTAGGFNYAAALKKAREKISLPAMGIFETKIRRTAGGGVLIEIPDKENKGLAEKLATKIQAVLGEEVKVTRPTVKGEMRISGFDNSVTRQELEEKLIDLGGCKKEDVKIGTPNRTFAGLYSIWTQCPIEAAIRIANQGKIHIGWTVAKVEILKSRPTRCFKCWEHGHLQVNCKSTVDRSKACFNCGGAGHRLAECTLPPKCVICCAKGHDFSHRIGTAKCVAGKMEVERRAATINARNG